MFDELSQDIKRAAGSTDTSACLDPVWLRATQIQRRRGVLFASVAASVSIVAVMAVGAIRSAEPSPGLPAAFPAESLGRELVTVPDVVGMRLVRAKAALRDEGLRGELRREIDCEPYTVQMKVKKGSLKDAVVEVEAKGRKGPHVVFCTASGRGLIDGQSPVAGIEVEVGSIIDLRSRMTGSQVVLENKVRKINGDD